MNKIEFFVNYHKTLFKISISLDIYTKVEALDMMMEMKYIVKEANLHD